VRTSKRRSIAKVTAGSRVACSAEQYSMVAGLLAQKGHCMLGEAQAKALPKYPQECKIRLWSSKKKNGSHTCQVPGCWTRILVTPPYVGTPPYVCGDR
jgi:hypothetical protein